jgi:hypothetical protein
MPKSRQWIPFGGLLATIATACYAVVQLHGQTPVPTVDLTNAAMVEVRDAQGQAVLQGQFMEAQEDDDDVERKAALTPTGSDADAAGEAEVEFARNGATKQEVEFSVRNLSPRTAFTFAIDGTDVATATTNSRGRAEVDVDVAIPGAAAAR